MFRMALPPDNADHFSEQFNLLGAYRTELHDRIGSGVVSLTTDEIDKLVEDLRLLRPGASLEDLTRVRIVVDLRSPRNWGALVIPR